MKYIKFYLSMLMFYAVDPEGGGGPVITEVNPVESPDAEPASMKDAIQGGIDKDAVAAGDKTVEDVKPINVVEKSEPEEKKSKKDKSEPVVKEVKEVKEEKQEKDDTKGITEDDLKMPEGLSQGSQERFQKLSNGYKEAKAELEQVRQSEQAAIAANMEFVQTMDSIGAGPEQLDIFVNYMDSIKNKNYEQAYKILSSELKQLSSVMGKEVSGVDLLADYPDLQNDVDNLEMSRERAIEIATARNVQNANKVQTERATQSQAQQENAKRVAQEAVLSIDSAMSELQRTDINYAAKEKIIMDKSKGQSLLEKIFAENTPDRWLSQLRLVYDAIQVAKPERQVHRNSLRPSGGGGEAEPNTMKEAISRGLGLQG